MCPRTRTRLEVNTRTLRAHVRWRWGQGEAPTVSDRVQDAVGFKIVGESCGCLIHPQSRASAGHLAGQVAHGRGHFEVAHVRAPEPNTVVRTGWLQRKIDLAAGMETNPDAGNGAANCALCFHQPLRPVGASIRLMSKENADVIQSVIECVKPLLCNDL